MGKPSKSKEPYSNVNRVVVALLQDRDEDEAANRSGLAEERRQAKPTIQDVKAHADAVFHDHARASAWLKRPRPQFSGKTPDEMLKTLDGRRAVDEILGQIEHGIFG